MAKKEINLVLDTMEKPNRPIGTFKQLDDITLNFQIIENGVPKNLTSQTIKLYVCKADKKIVEQTSGIQTVSAEEGKIKIDMLNAATQVEGIALGEVVITGEGKTISTANFYFQVDRSIHNGEFIKSTNVIPLLDELESTLEDAKRKADSISIFEKEAKEKEDERIKNETGRVEAEKNRVKEFTKWTDAKFLVDDSKITDSKTWSSKKIVDYVQSNDTTWTPKTIEGDAKVDHTNNGYIKGLEIEGQTLKNITGISFKDKREFSEFSPKANLENGYIKINSADVAIISTKPFNIDKSKEYTLILDFKFSSDFNSDSMDRDRFLLNDGAKSKEYTFTTPIQYSYNELKTMSSPIKIKLTNNISDNQIKSGLRGYFYDVKQGYIKFRYMILEGDYTQKDVPDFIDGVQGVGLKTEKGYKIGVKTHGKNLIKTNSRSFTLKSVSTSPALVSINGIIEKNIPIKNNGTYMYTFLTNSKYRACHIFLHNEPIPRESTLHDQVYRFVVSEGRGVEKKTNQFTTDSYKYITFTTGGTFSNTIASVGSVITYYNLQLEGGTQATKYEPYKESTQEVIIQQQLNTGDKLVFENGEYIIKTSEGQTVKTNINNEMLPATFDEVTYVEQDTGVKGILKGQFPINSQAAITSLENRNKELEERLGQHEEMLTTLYSFYRGTLEETEHIEEDIMTTEEL